MRHFIRRMHAATFALLALVFGCVAQSQGTQATAPRLLYDSKPGEVPTLLVLGTAHLANPGRDLVNVHVDDVLTPKRQAQIAKVVEELAAFRPTFIALEWPQAAQSKLDASYDDYRAGRRELTAKEGDQFGMRLAAKLNLPRVHAVDWINAPPGDEKSYNYPAWAERHGQKPTLQAMIERTTATTVRLAPEEPIANWLIRMNRPQSLLDNHRMYFDIATIGDSESQPGAAWVGGWYARNLRIFTSLTRLGAGPQDRILVIFGQGHAHLLRQFARESGAFRLVDVDQVLEAE
jgi:Family of unknown function (DUF5694)